MYHSIITKRGFTLVEIMIVVVIIGLLAVLAVPAWQRVRWHTIRSTMDNDARQLASAAQQYFMEYGVSSVDVTYDRTSGEITGSLADRVRFVGVHYTSISPVLYGDADFQLEHEWLSAPRTYNPEGRPLD